jgi:pimeloyl-ACP methyl ester carboxylesterase
VHPRGSRPAASAPDARHVIATESGHYIQLQQPELVIDAIHQVVDGVRGPPSWYGLQCSF